MALGYLVRLAAGPEGVACTSPLPSSPDPLTLLVQEGVAPTPSCTLVFLLLYFSSLAAAMWWALATASWAVMVLCSLEPKVPPFHLNPTSRWWRPGLPSSTAWAGGPPLSLLWLL